MTSGFFNINFFYGFPCPMCPMSACAFVDESAGDSVRVVGTAHTVTGGAQPDGAW
jgi:hypothetical protein